MSAGGEVAYQAPPRRDAMLKLVHLLRRKPGLTLAEFQEHWLESHTRFALASPAVRRYVQYHTLADDPIRQALAQAASGPLVDGYDGVAIAWFDDAHALADALPSLTASIEDERYFVDSSRSVAVLTDEHVIVEPLHPAPIVLIECLARVEAIDRRRFSSMWLEHSAIGRKAAARGLLAGYIQNHALPEDDPRLAALPAIGGGEEVWDGVVTAYFQSVAIAKDLFADPLAAEEAFEDERGFIDHDKGIYMLARRRVVKDLVR